MFVIKRESSRLAVYASRDCGKGKEEVGERESVRGGGSHSGRERL